MVDENQLGWASTIEGIYTFALVIGGGFIGAYFGFEYAGLGGAVLGALVGVLGGIALYWIIIVFAVFAIVGLALIPVILVIWLIVRFWGVGI